MSSSDLNPVLLKISDQLSSENLDNMKFLCRDMIGKKDLEKVTTGSKLFLLLMERGKLGPDNTECLSKLLTDIERKDLSDKLQGLEGESGDRRDQPDDTERAKLDIATEVIAENLGRSWRKLGRKLGLKEIKLESINRRHPTDLEETAVELLKEWRKSQGAGARVEQLIEALRLCQFNLTADKVEDKLKKIHRSDETEINSE
ncbi:FAS-associated death domain protein-like [Seriola lalandi dorsalis]|uniref:Fas (tnfrsf6)-associated via death domain n=1 Tax=Seriola lalandi dorsalis TaxID=1841481 RepID=A0A3B4XJM6_SERLL|nr:FAS-associated death domain protein-like [Seriola lalandi dorsalis]XP_056239563.1 protein FADD [Seriola aureovittata]